MKKILLIIIHYSLLITHSPAQQPLGLQQAYELAQRNYPLLKQRQLIRQTSDYTVENLGKGFLPQFSLNAQATYQSEVTQVKIQVPGISMEPLNKDQYKILADVSQLIYDGGLIQQQKNIQHLTEETEQQRLEVDLFQLKERINQLFLGVIFLDEQLKQVDLVKADLNNGIKKVEAQVNNGVAFRSNLNVLKAELLKAEQRDIELRSSRKGFIDVLGLFLNQSLPENIRLEKPVPATTALPGEIQRPELMWYAAQEKLLGGQFKLLDAKNKPRASLFWQGGYGRPGLNFLNNEFDFFYTAGVRLNWSFGAFYLLKREKKVIELSQKMINTRKETFLLNTNTQLSQQRSEMEKLQKLIDTDKAIIDLRIKVKDAAKAQLENGVITANDYLREVNAEDLARQSLILHEVQLLQARINHQTISGNQ